jgi:hypothetical protein
VDRERTPNSSTILKSPKSASLLPNLEQITESCVTLGRLLLFLLSIGEGLIIVTVVSVTSLCPDKQIEKMYNEMVYNYIFAYLFILLIYNHPPTRCYMINDTYKESTSIQEIQEENDGTYKSFVSG